MSDWDAQHSVLDANNGLDQTMPGDGLNGGNFFGQQLLNAVNNGSVPTSRLNVRPYAKSCGLCLTFRSGYGYSYPRLVVPSRPGFRLSSNKLQCLVSIIWTAH